VPITYGQAKETLSQYAGRGGVCPSDDRVNLFVREVLDYLLISGHYGNLHTFSFCAVKGCFTIPFELEVPLKVKIDGEIGSVWTKWYEFHASKTLERCMPAARALYEEANYYPTVYEVPEGGSKIGCVAICEEAEDSSIIVQGPDTSGREIITYHNGVQITGEYLSIKKGELRYTGATFGKITSIKKSKTKGYVQLLAVNPEKNQRTFLADYSPLETSPAYRRFRITDSQCKDTVKVTILGRIRLRDHYSDNDYIPFDNFYTLNLAGQVINANYNNAPDLAKAKDDALNNVIMKDNEHHRIENGVPIEVYPLTSAGAIKNIVF